MKKTSVNAVAKFLMLFGFIFMQLNVWAQDSTTAATRDKANDFLSQPWVWVVGGVILLLILAAIFSGSKKHKQITKTTVIKEEKTV